MASFDQIWSVTDIKMKAQTVPLFMTLSIETGQAYTVESPMMRSEPDFYEP